MLPYPLTNFEIQKYNQNRLKFKGVYSKNNSPKIKERANAVNPDEYRSIESHWIPLYGNDNNVTYFDSFRVEYIPKKYKKYIGNKNITTNTSIKFSNIGILLYWIY